MSLIRESRDSQRPRSSKTIDAADYLVKAFREVGHVAELAVDGEEAWPKRSMGNMTF
jgi:hypothetical protein